MADAEDTKEVCVHCGGQLWAITEVHVSHPYPVAKMNKELLKKRGVTIHGAELKGARPFCTNPECSHQGRPMQPARTRTELIQDLMRELINRGMPAVELQQLVGGHVSAIDMLAAAYPKGLDL